MSNSFLAEKMAGVTGFLKLATQLQIPPGPPFCELGEKLPIPAKPDSKWGISSAVIGEHSSLWQREVRRDLKILRCGKLLWKNCILEIKAD